MSLKLWFHPLSSFSQKVLIALYENDTPFEPHILDPGNERSLAELKALWPFGKFPVLRDEAADRTIPESSIIIEYLAEHHPGPVRLVPAARGGGERPGPFGGARRRGGAARDGRAGTGRPGRRNRRRGARVPGAAASRAAGVAGLAAAIAVSPGGYTPTPQPPRLHGFPPLPT